MKNSLKIDSVLKILSKSALAGARVASKTTIAGTLQYVDIWLYKMIIVLSGMDTRLVAYETVFLDDARTLANAV